MTQRAQRIRPCRAPGWNDGRGDHGAQDDAERTREGGAVGRADAEQHAAEKPADAECRDQTERRANRPEPQAACESRVAILNSPLDIEVRYRGAAYCDTQVASSVGLGVGSWEL
jgi:hypothetical protein